MKSMGVWGRMAEASPDIFCTIDLEGRFVYVNEACERILGYSRENLCGRPYAELLHPGCLTATQNAASALRNGAQSNSFENRLIHKSGRVVPVLWSAVWSEEDAAYFLIGRDLSECRKRELQLKENQGQHQAQLENLSLVASKTTHGIIITNADGITEWVNEGFTKLTGYQPAEVIGKKPGSLLQGPNTDPGTVAYIRQMITQAVPFNAMLINYRKSGESMWISMDITPVFNETGKLLKFIAVQKNIDERIRIQQELEKLSLVASKTTNGVIITDRNRKIEWVNEAFSKITGYSFEDAHGKTPYELLHHEKTDPQFYVNIQGKLERGEPVSFEVLNCKKGGRNLWLSVEVNPVVNEKGELERFISTQTDITDIVTAQQELEKLSLVASKANNGIFITDNALCIEWVNEGFVKLMGYTLEEAAGKRPSQLLNLRQEDTPQHDKIRAKLYNGEGASFETQIVTKSGEETWVSVEMNSFSNEAGKLAGFTGVVTDISALKNSELELSTLSQDLSRKNSDLQQFTYIVSHNLRAPVANALGLTQMLTQLDKNSEKFDHSLAFLQQSITQLDTVLRDINTILSIRDSKENLEQEQVQVHTVIQEVITSLEEPRLRCGAQVINDVAEGLCVQANRAYLYSIFYNLLSNAIKYRAKDRGLEVRITCFHSAERGTLLSITDNGSGFDMQKAKGNIFKLYKRFHPRGEGSGIGLYLIKTHVEAMGGHIEVSSQQGVGTRFLIYLP